MTGRLWFRALHGLLFLSGLTVAVTVASTLLASPAIRGLIGLSMLMGSAVGLLSLCASLLRQLWKSCGFVAQRLLYRVAKVKGLESTTPWAGTGGCA